MGSKLHIFEDKKVRSYWDPEKEEWYFSAVDVCYVLAESASKDPGAYWRIGHISSKRFRQGGTRD